MHRNKQAKPPHQPAVAETCWLGHWGHSGVGTYL